MRIIMLMLMLMLLLLLMMMLMMMLMVTMMMITSFNQILRCRFEICPGCPGFDASTLQLSRYSATGSIDAMKNCRRRPGAYRSEVVGRYPMNGVQY